MIEILERCYRDAEDSIRRPERIRDGVPEPTEVDARAAHQASSELLALGLVAGPWEDWLRISWFPYLRQFPGVDRRVGQGWEINDHLARFRLDGDVGRVFVTTRFDPEGQLVGMSDSTREKEEGNPPSGVTIACPPEHMVAMKTFYKSLLDRDLPCREAGDPYLRPRWPDPKYPQQMHLDVLVADLDAAEEIALINGGRSSKTGARTGPTRIRSATRCASTSTHQGEPMSSRVRRPEHWPASSSTARNL